LCLPRSASGHSIIGHPLEIGTTSQQGSARPLLGRQLRIWVNLTLEAGEEGISRGFGGPYGIRLLSPPR
jgi:hypothetical protein